MYIIYLVVCKLYFHVYSREKNVQFWHLQWNLPVKNGSKNCYSYILWTIHPSSTCAKNRLTTT